jgi:hypothetical protein
MTRQSGSKATADERDTMVALLTAIADKTEN